MGQPSTQRRSSFGHLLVVSVLVGFPLDGLGLALVDALSLAAPFASLEAGLLFGTVTVAVLWIAGFRPSLRASVGFFVATHALQLLFVTGSVFLIPTASGLSPWQEVGLRTLSIAIPAALAFTPLGTGVRTALRTQGRRLAKLPPE